MGRWKRAPKNRQKNDIDLHIFGCEIKCAMVYFS